MKRNEHRSKAICFECGKPAEYEHHVVPKCKGGTKTVPLCSTCHALIHDLGGLQTRQLTRMALSRNKRHNFKTGGICPYGFTVTHKGQLILNTEEQKVISYILLLMERDWNYSQIARHLNALGYKTKTGRKWYPQTVKNASQAKRMIRTKFYNNR